MNYSRRARSLGCVSRHATPFSARLTNGEGVGNSICKSIWWKCTAAASLLAVVSAWLPSLHNRQHCKLEQRASLFNIYQNHVGSERVEAKNPAACNAPEHHSLPISKRPPPKQKRKFAPTESLPATAVNMNMQPCAHILVEVKTPLRTQL